jgi:hypothetical protein
MIHSRKERVRVSEKIFYKVGIVLILLVLSGIINSCGDKNNEKPMATKSEKAVVNNYALDPLIAEFKNDPDIQEWMEIKKRTTPFKEDKKWIKDTFEYLREPNRKWDVVKDKQILMRVDKVYGEHGMKPFKSDKRLYEEYEKQLDMLLQQFRDKIVKSVVCKNMVSFPIAFDGFEKLVSSYGFVAAIKDEGRCGFWPVYKYYKDYRTQGGKTKGKGQSFTASVNQDGSIIDIDIPLGEGKYDYKKLGKDRAADNKMFKNFLKEHLSNPAEWISSSLNLIFGQDAQTVANKMTEIGKADDAKLKEMYSGDKDKFRGFDFWFTSFSIGGKNITINNLFEATTMSIKMDESYRLWDIYNKISLKEVL